MAEDGLDGLLIFRQETMYYLTGYDTFGYVFFQCLVLAADGRMFLLTRAPDLRQAQNTPVIEDIAYLGRRPRRRIRPASLRHPARARPDRGAPGRRVRGLWADRLQRQAPGGRLRGRLPRSKTPRWLVSRQRVVKSEAEIAYVRRAAELGRRRLRCRRALAAPGAFEGEILAAMQGAVFKRRRRLSGQRVHHRLGRAAPCCAATTPAGAISTRRTS